MIQIQKHTKQDKSKSQSQEFTTNRYSVLYTLKGQYQHVGCSSEEEAQYVLGTLMTDGNRIPIGIYDSKTDTFEWEIIGQYFHAQDPMSNRPAGTPARNPDRFKSIKKKRQQLAARGNGESEFLCVMQNISIEAKLAKRAETSFQSGCR
jgi:hypothetical protein